MSAVAAPSGHAAVDEITSQYAATMRCKMLDRKEQKVTCRECCENSYLKPRSTGVQHRMLGRATSARWPAGATSDECTSSCVYLTGVRQPFLLEI